MAIADRVGKDVMNLLPFHQRLYSEKIIFKRIAIGSIGVEMEYSINSCNIQIDVSCYSINSSNCENISGIRVTIIGKDIAQHRIR